MRRLPFLLTLLACNGGKESAAEFFPAVTFLEPEQDAVVAVGDVPVSIVVDDFVLTAPETARLGDWLAFVIPQAQAHGEEGETPAGYCDLALDDAHVANLSETQSSVGVDAGNHTLTCTLKYADGDALYPAVTASVSFEAEE